MKKKNKRLYIIISLLVLSLAVTYTDAFIKPNYFTKIPIKVIAFLAIPISYFLIYKKEFNQFKRLFKHKKNDIKKALSIGIPIYILIVTAYYLTRNIIDYSNVAPNLTKSMGITKSNFLYVTLYISILNSFLEEFFFRGYGFITLKKYTSKKFAYIFSPILFAIYHIGMLINSFHPGIIILLLVGLFIGGCIFNYLNEKNNNIYVSWLVHMLCNLGINTVGAILFGIF